MSLYARFQYLLSRAYQTTFARISICLWVAVALTPLFFLHAAEYVFTQNSWEGGVLGIGAVHPDNQSNVTTYTSNTGIVAMSTNLELAYGARFLTHTTENDFDGVFTNAEVAGLGIDASLVPSEITTDLIPWTNMAITPANMGPGKSFAYTGDDYIYASRGSNSNAFYRYSLSGNIWASMTVLPGTVNAGGGIVYGGGDYIYAIRGNNTSDFYRYSISGNSWTTVTSAPAAITDGGSIARGEGDYIYVLRGGNTNTFYRYSISEDAWTTLAVSPVNMVQGSSLTYVGEGAGYLYVLRGNLPSHFHRYSIENDSWETLTPMSTITGIAVSLVYVGGDHIYALRGSSNTDFLRYSISEDTWTPVVDMSVEVGSGTGALIYTGGNHIYASSENREFHRYTISKDISSAAWELLGPSVFGGASTRLSNTALYDGDEYIYYIGIANNGSLHRYSLAEDSWTALTSLPTGSTYLSAVYEGGDYIYALGSSWLRRYSISGNSWTTLSTTPVTFGGGLALVHTGDDYLYAFRGSSSTTFYRYSLLGNEWTTMTSTASNVNEGGALVWTGGDYIYARRGNSGRDLYRYSISGNVWSSMARVPAGAAEVGVLVWDEVGGYLYALRGARNKALYRYSIEDDTWATLPPVPSDVTFGGTLAVVDNRLYVTPGGTTNFYVLDLSITNSGFVSPFAVYLSESIDLAAAQPLQTFNFDTTISVDAGVSLAIRAGGTEIPDDTWTQWRYRIQDGDDLSYLGEKRYVQYRATLTSNGLDTPMLDSAEIGYEGYMAEGEIISLPYDTGDLYNAIAFVSWIEDEVVPDGTEVVVSVRTSDTEEGLDDSSWEDFSSVAMGCTKDITTVTCGTDALSDESTDGVDDRFIQYKVTLISETAVFTPTIESVSLGYQETVAYFTLSLQIINDSGGVLGADDFGFNLSEEIIVSGVSTPFVSGAYVLSYADVPEYAVSISGDCAPDGTIVLVAGATYTCSVVADDISGDIPPESRSSARRIMDVSIVQFNQAQYDALIRELYMNLIDLLKQLIVALIKEQAV